MVLCSEESMSSVRRFAAVGVSLGAFFLTTGALAADPCDNITGQTNSIPILFVENGDTQELMLKRVGKQLIQSGSKLRIVYRNRPTCELAQNFYTTRNLA